MKKYAGALIILCLALVLCCSGCTADADSSPKEANAQDFEYKVLSDGTAEITGYNGKDAVLRIPSKLDGHKVISIGDEAFYSPSYNGKEDYLISVIIPDGVTSIGNQAFFERTKLISVSIPDSVTSIGTGAFQRCFFLSCVKIPKGVTSILKFTFSECSSLKSLVIPDGVTLIGSRAFESCTNLTSLTIPDSVTSFGDYPAFEACPNLTIITNEGSRAAEQARREGISCTNDFSKAEEQGVFYKQGDFAGILYSDGTAEIASYYGREEKVKIPSEIDQHRVVSIGRSAFYPNVYNNSKKIKSIIIPDGVTYIGGAAFASCRSLTDINIPSSVTFIGNSAFHTCESLTSITIPDGVTTINDSTFYGCDSLNSVTISKGVTSIGDFAFAACEKLTQVTIPDGVTSIGEQAFAGCISLTEIILPESVTSIGENAFYNCQNLTITRR